MKSRYCRVGLGCSGLSILIHRSDCETGWLHLFTRCSSTLVRQTDIGKSCGLSISCDPSSFASRWPLKLSVTLPYDAGDGTTSVLVGNMPAYRTCGACSPRERAMPGRARWE